MPSVSSVAAATLPSTDAVVVGLYQSGDRPTPAPGAAPVLDALGAERLAAALGALGARGAADEVHLLPTLGQTPFPLLVTTGLGAAPASGATTDPEALRRAVGAAIRRLSRHRRVHLAIDGPGDALAEGALMGSYSYTEYKSSAPTPVLSKITIATGTDRAALRRAGVVAEAVARTRDLVNAPPNDLYPETFAARARELATAAGLEVTVLGPRELARGKYGGILGVGAGSVRPPRLVHLRYTPARPRARVALVGKGVTYDSGGLNLKPGPSLSWMKTDMGGGAAVVAAVCAAAALRLPVAVTATVPMVENMPSGSAYRPSDVLRMRDGRTVEVTDTDAEGRLILADAITHALAEDPEYLVETSTLTGGQVVALGPRVIGAMGEDAFRDRVVAAGRTAGEALWPMPLPEHLRPGLDSAVADLKNLPTDRWGSMLVAGEFLAEFVPDGLPWVHLDVAGPSWNGSGPRDYTPKGATGSPVRTLIATLADLADLADGA